MTTRRELLIALGALAALPAYSQQPGKVWRVGYLSVFSSKNNQAFEVFKQQLRDLGQVERKTITIDFLSAEGNYDRLPSLAADLVRLNVDVIVAAGGTPVTTAAKNATRTIPIVFQGIADPVGQGFVTSLARPGGNITGATDMHRDTAGKSLSILKEVIPSAKRIAILSNPKNSSLPQVILDMQAAARLLRLDTTIINVATPNELEKAFAEIARDRPAGLVILADGLFISEAGRLATLAAKHRLPTLARLIAFPESGGLMSYGANRLELIRHAAILVDKIIKGAKPSDLPVEQPTKFDFVINMKTAKAMGLTIPQSVLLQASRVIE